MSKCFFFGFPSVSVSKTLIPVIDKIASGNYEIIYYNTAGFRPSGEYGFRFNPYPDYFDAYVSDKMNEDISYFQFGDILIDITTRLMDFLLEVTLREKPEFIIYSHLAVWGKLIARHYKLPAITLYTTFILDKRIMLPYFRKLNAGRDSNFGHVHDAIVFHRKCQSLYSRLQLTDTPDPWDVYINKGDLNLSFILQDFQPQRNLLDPDFTFLGYPCPSGGETKMEKEVIYVAMGTVLNKDVSFYKLCIDVLRDLNINCIISAGSNVAIEELGKLPENIQVVAFIDQAAVLKKAILFITRGGMASVHESIYALTPMIAITAIPEQQLTGETIQELGIGIHLPAKQLTGQALRDAIQEILVNKASYILRLEALLKRGLSLPPQEMAFRLIDRFFKNTVIDLFIQQAEKRPDAIAVRCGEEYITYKDLHERTNQLAHYLQRKGITREDIVPVIMEPGIDVVVAIWGIIKAGAAYVPVDPEYPVERIGYMLKDTGCRIALSAKSAGEKLLPDSHCLLVLMDDHWHLIGAEPIAVPSGLPVPTDLAYIIYTSGSTGRPKGVMVEHAQILTYTLDICDRLQLRDCESYAIIGTFSADAGLTAFFAALCFGKSLSIIDVKKFSHFKALTGHLEKFPVDCYKTTPSLMELFLRNEGANEIIPRKRLILGGEACPRSLADTLVKMLPDDCTLYNHYGPTETTVGVITYQFPRESKELPEVIPLGIPLNNVRTCILDDNTMPVAHGDAGELYIEGPLLARGYLNDRDLTRHKFITQSTGGNEKRWYKTGDLVRIMRDGNIAYLGRMDDQVKIHGYRIELKEIENVVLLSGMVRQCVVVAREKKTDGKYLAAYIIPGNGFGKNDLMDLLKRKLPGHMIPAKLVLLTEWPLTFNNKIDNLALPDPEMEEQKDTDRAIYAGDEMVMRLIMIWRQLLGVEDIREGDNFFELGGDSLMLIKLSFEIYNQLSIEIAPADLFSYLTPDKLAAFLSIKNKIPPPAAETAMEGFDAMEASAVQKKLFLRYRLNPAESFPNSSVTYLISGSMDIERLENAFITIIKENESLRSAFMPGKGKLYKKIDADCTFSLELIRCDKPDIDEEIMAVTKPFDPGSTPLIRAYIIETEDMTRYLHIDMPHINSDGESLTVIMNNLEAIYNNKYNKKRRLQFTDYQKRLYSYLNSDGYRADELYWKKQLSGDVPAMNLHFVSRAARPLQFDGVFTVFRFPTSFSERIHHYIKGKNLTRFQFLLNAYICLLHKVTSAGNIAILIPVHNRNEPGFEDIIGLLSNMILVKVCIRQDQSIRDLVTYCRDLILESMSHQRYPFDNIRSLWKAMGRDVRDFPNSYFAYHYGKSEYLFGEASLKLHIPSKNKERLPLSAAVFQAGTDLVLRLSSTAGVYNRAGLEDLAMLYYKILDLMMNNDENISVGAMLNDVAFIGSKPPILSIK
jgi:MGT family glycosyltransferase